MALAGAFILQFGYDVTFAQTTPSPSAGATSAAQACPLPGPDMMTAEPCLAKLATSGIYGFNALEIAAAQSDDAAFVSLVSICGGNIAPGGRCGVPQFNLYTRLSQLEYNAETLLGYGTFANSLNLTAQGVGFALRWTADEEFATQSSLTTRLANNQFAAISNRLTALRFAQTLRLARQDAYGTDSDLADGNEPGAYGGGASADSPYGAWSVFANGSYGAGTKAATTYDDAFDFGGTQYNAGADVRVSRHIVLGLLVDSLNQHADFDSSESIAAGHLQSDGLGVAGYMQLDWDAAYLNLSVGAQRLSLDTARVVAYPSNNPQIPSVDTTFYSSTNVTAWLISLGSGYAFHVRGFSAEPYLNGQYLNVRISAFSESASGPDLGFAASVAPQSIESLVGVAGLKFQYAFLPSFGVVLPYAYGEFRREFRNPSQNVDSQFTSTVASSGTDYYQLPTDDIKPDYYEVGAGAVAVLPHGCQFYLQYMKVLQLQYYTDYVASAGIRYEF